MIKALYARQELPVLLRTVLSLHNSFYVIYNGARDSKQDCVNRFILLLFGLDILNKTLPSLYPSRWTFEHLAGEDVCLH